MKRRTGPRPGPWSCEEDREESEWKKVKQKLQVLLVRGYYRHYFLNHIRAFPNTPNCLTSRVDLLEPGPLDYGLVPIYGYGKGPSEGDDSTSLSDRDMGPRTYEGHGSGTYSMGGMGPSCPRGSHNLGTSRSNSLMSQHGFHEHRVHGHPITSPN
ncbi:hypothetical protein Cgig2_030095 [Carnegiea gigantea]|uniref:Uncharacterized protein n=1 Tax=Carnegiea gigantea TaxID=171969 RepID=A0A9Q1JJH2_9CARY|nr:hypothetical protein Cgig2_030095 [Carnegiea gigantea]